eukprot:TRINITY_DN8100_c0_g1_i1.p1 TRINITY_DN8100_c0_g1~~TRINITY_DN8100_c0_g1_i1.p1  ORF type:complete len:525 (-),score=75.15 TRINITY_DN8100_c0_g1_i1:35-1525(-)
MAGLDMVQSIQIVMTLAIIAVVRLLWSFPRRVAWASGTPVFGLGFQIFRALLRFTIHDEFAEMHGRLGKTFAYHVLGQPFVATIDPKVIEYILKTNFENFIKGSMFRKPLTQLLGDGIFNVDGQLWYHQRKVSSKMFTKKQFEGHIFKVVSANTMKIRDILKKSAGEVFCMFDLMNRFTLDTIGEIGFSKSIGSIEDPDSPFLKSFDFAQQSMIKRFWIGQTIEWWKLFRFLGLFWEKELPAHFSLLNNYCDDIVNELLQKVTRGDDNSFVGMFIKDPEGADLLKRDEKKFRIFIRDMVLNFLLAGRDTTAQCLTWTLFEMAQAPQVVNKVREEVSAVCGTAPIAYSDIAQLRYTNAVLHEGLRLHPSVPIDGKITVARDTLPGGIVVPAGCLVQYNAYAQGRCREFWGEDAEQFRPERWLELPNLPSSFEFSAFHAGPRECLGKRLAMVEMITFVASFVRDFDFSLCCQGSEVKYDAQLTLGCSSGLPMRVTARA